MFEVRCNLYGQGGKTNHYANLLVRQDTPRATTFDDRAPANVSDRVPSIDTDVFGATGKGLAKNNFLF